MRSPSLISPLLVCLMGWVPLHAQVSQSVLSQRDIDASRTRAEENARQSRAQLQLEFARIDRNLAAANNAISAGQIADAQRMNDGVSTYLKMVHDEEARVRKLQEERSKKAKAEMEVFFANMARSQREYDAAQEKRRTEEKQRQQQEFIHDAGLASGPQAKLGQRLLFLRNDLYFDRTHYWDRLVAAGFKGASSARDLFWQVMNRIGDPRGRAVPSAAEQQELIAILSKVPLEELAQRLAPPNYVGMLKLIPEWFARDPLWTEPVIKTLATFHYAGETALAADGVSALLPSVEKLSHDVLNSGGPWRTTGSAAGRHTIALMLWKDLGQPELAHRFIGLYNSDDAYDPLHELDAACQTAALLSTREINQVKADQVSNMILDQVWVQLTIPAEKRRFGDPIPVILKLQAMLRAHPQWKTEQAQQRLQIGGQLQKARADFAAYRKALKETTDRALRRRNNALFPDAEIESLRAEINAEGNPRAFDAAEALLKICQHKPRWRPERGPDDRIRLVSAWLAALRHGTTEQRAALLKGRLEGYPGMISIPNGKYSYDAGIDRNLYFLDADLNWDFFATTALLGLEELCDANGKPPENPDAWLARFEDYAKQATPAGVVARWLQVLERANAGDRAATNLVPFGRLAVGRLASRSCLAHRPALDAMLNGNQVGLPVSPEIVPGFRVPPVYIRARATWELRIAENKAPLEAAREAVEQLQPTDAAALAFALKAHEQLALADEPLLIPADPNFPAMLLRAVEKELPDANLLWSRLLAAEPITPKSEEEWEKLATTGKW